MAYQGQVAHPTDGYLFSFPNIAWQPGEIKAVGYKRGGEGMPAPTSKPPARPTRIKLTPIVGPKGLQADGSDVALFDVEVVDAQGRRCPTDEARVDFKVSGPCIWRGGYNSGISGSTNNLYLNTECGINRVAIRSTLQPGEITLTATRAGLTPAKVVITSIPFEVTGGLATEPPATLPGPVAP